MGQRQSEIIKNHMEVYWHDYASASKGFIRHISSISIKISISFIICSNISIYLLSICSRNIILIK